MNLRRCVPLACAIMKILTRCFLLPLLFLAGCTADAPTEENNNSAKPATAAMAVKLDLADKVDGTEDKVVHKCAGCSLGMDGKKEMALQVGDYEMHFCKDACLAKFKDDTEKAVTALTIPK